MYLIYCHKNKINGKRYIGLTSYVENPNKRWRNGLTYLNSHHKVFAKALAKYGWDNFDHEVLETNIPTLEVANQQEKYWIAYYHSYVGDPKCWGYNCTSGGDSSCGLVYTEAMREYRRQLKLGTKASEETRRKMSEARKGKPQNMTPKKIAQIKSICKYSAEVTRKAVKCIETGEIWPSVNAAAKSLGVAPTTVSACLNGRQKTVKKLHIQFL